jgi:hypothetical protein
MSVVASAIFIYLLYFGKLGTSCKLVVCPSCSMRDLAICTNPLAREVMHLLQRGRVFDTEGSVYDTISAEGDRDTLHAKVTPTLQLVEVERRVLGKRLSMMGCRVPDVCAKRTRASGLLKR